MEVGLPIVLSITVLVVCTLISERLDMRGTAESLRSAALCREQAEYIKDMVDAKRRRTLSQTNILKKKKKKKDQEMEMGCGSSADTRRRPRRSATPRVMITEMRRVIRMKNRNTLQIMGRMARTASCGMHWRTINIDVKGASYLLLLGVHESLNRDFRRWKREKHLTSILDHPGARCIVVDIRTQSTMLACTDLGRQVINCINAVMFKIMREARAKLWEPVVLTYEISDQHKIHMLKMLEAHISVGHEKTWRDILSNVHRCNSGSAETGMIYNPNMAVLVSNVSTGYKEALCRDSIQFIYGQTCTINRVRPKWLKSPHSRYSLELDVFCEAEAVAVEYNGKQHYMFDRESEMKDRVEKDLSKLFQTRDRRVNLIVVPYLVSDKDILRHIVLSVACGYHR